MKIIRPLLVLLAFALAQTHDSTVAKPDSTAEKALLAKVRGAMETQNAMRSKVAAAIEMQNAMIAKVRAIMETQNALARR